MGSTEDLQFTRMEGGPDGDEDGVDEPRYETPAQRRRREAGYVGGWFTFESLVLLLLGMILVMSIANWVTNVVIAAEAYRIVDQTKRDTINVALRYEEEIFCAIDRTFDSILCAVEDGCEVFSTNFFGDDGICAFISGTGDHCNLGPAQILNQCGLGSSSHVSSSLHSVLFSTSEHSPISSLSS